MPAEKNGKVVLAIDDDPFVRDMYRAILEEAGFEVLDAADGPSGVAQFKARKFDCVLLDIYMKGMSGLDVLEEIDPDRTGVPVIAISGGGSQSGAQTLVLAESLGATRTMEKDFEHADLVTAVRELTGLAP